MDIWSQIKAFGPDLVFTLSDLRLNKIEAEELLQKLLSIDGTINEFKSEQELTDKGDEK